MLNRLVFIILLLFTCGNPAAPRGLAPQAVAPTIVPTPTPAITITFGAGSSVITESFDLKAGPLEALFIHNGDGRFYAVLLDAADNRTLLIDEIGNLGINRKETYPIPAPGRYRLDVFSVTKWTIQLKQP